MVTPEDFRLLAGAGDLATYQFGTMTARHHFCRHCGVAPFIRPRSYPENYILKSGVKMTIFKQVAPTS